MNSSASNIANRSPWPFRLTLLLIGVVFPLIWVGGLVTTYDAGMAFPDWPTSSGYNMFLYPLGTWLSGPWDRFIEHGHRLLGATAGFVTIAIVVSTYATRQTVFVRGLAWGALALVIAQGLLGGSRVLLDTRNLALLHGCIGPAYFTYCVAMAVVMSRRWHATTSKFVQQAVLLRSAFVGIALAYGQLVLGAFLRHPADSGSPQQFQLVLLFHIVTALALVGHSIGYGWTIYRRAKGEAWLTRPVAVLVVSTLVQIALGVATVLVKYGWPTWLGGEAVVSGFTVTAKGFWSSMIVTAHVANGSLILATWAVLSVRSQRLVGWNFSSPTEQAKDSSGNDAAQHMNLLGATP